MSMYTSFNNGNDDRIEREKIEKAEKARIEQERIDKEKKNAQVDPTARYTFDLTPPGMKRSGPPQTEAAAKFEKDMSSLQPAHTQPQWTSSQKEGLAKLQQDANAIKAKEAQVAERQRSTQVNQDTARAEQLKVTMANRLAASKAGKQLDQPTQAQIEQTQLRNQIVADLRKEGPNAKLNVEWNDSKTGELMKGEMKLQGKELVLTNSQTGKDHRWDADSPVRQKQSAQDSCKSAAEQFEKQQDMRKLEKMNLVDALKEKKEGITSNSGTHAKLEGDKVVFTKADGTKTEKSADDVRAKEEARLEAARVAAEAARNKSTLKV